jgi:2-succinyl-6-hydroxy-2,4-cyclohexadiene-1-carboxylate synthase
VSTTRVEADGVSLFVESEGSGPPVVLLHGFTGSGRTLAGTAAALRPGFRTVRVDLVGHGRSDAPSNPAAYALEACAAQVAHVIERTCDGSAHVLGYSMGGRVALGLAVAHPARVRSTILIGARAGLADPAVRAERRRADEALARDLERDGLEAFVERWMALPLFASQARLGPGFLAGARRERLSQPPAGLAASLRGMGAGAQPPLFERLGEVDAPSLIVVGEQDERFAAVADDLARRLPRARAVRIAGAGHAAHLERPEAFARVAREFLHEAEPRAARPARKRIEPEREETCRT